MEGSHLRLISALSGIALGWGVCGIALQAHAVGDDVAPASQKSADPDYRAGKTAIEAQDWNAAIAAFDRAAARDPNNADIQNYLGYSYRKAGNLDSAFRHYQTALKLSPDHRGAHEYIGEAYLMKGDLKMAKQHLAALDRICLFGCEEFRALKKAVAQYEESKR